MGTASKESVDATVRETVRLKYECGATDRAIARHRAQYGCVHPRARCRGEASLAAASDTDGPSAGSDSVSQRRPAARFASQGPEPDWTRVHRELRRARVTLILQWEEYRAYETGGYSYSRWCELYRRWESRRWPMMLQTHSAGERMLVDYIGQTVERVDGPQGEIRRAQALSL